MFQNSVVTAREIVQGKGRTSGSERKKRAWFISLL